MGEVATIILAGGRGTRLHPLTLHHAKPAICFGGRYRLIDIPISNSLHANFRQIFIIAQYLSGELQHHIHQTYQFAPFYEGYIEVLTPQEDELGQRQWFEGTADAVRKNLPTLLKSSAEYFLILSGDQLYHFSFKELIDFAKEQEAELTLAAMPITGKEASRMGLLQVSKEGKVHAFIEKPEGQEKIPFAVEPGFFGKEKENPKEPCYLASMGIYVFRREAMIRLLQEDLRPDFGYHLIQTAVARGKTSAFLYDGYWEDIGTVASYHEANLKLTRQEGLNTHDEMLPIYTRRTHLPGPQIHNTKIVQSIICEGSIIEAEEITRCVIGLCSHIQEGTVLRDTVMLGNYFFEERAVSSKAFWIGKDCHIEKAIIDEQVQIGDRVKLLNHQNLTHYNGEGIFIREGIWIITSETKIPDDFEM